MEAESLICQTVKQIGAELHLLSLGIFYSKQLFDVIYIDNVNVKFQI